MDSKIPHRELLLWLSGIFGLRVLAQWWLQQYDSTFLPGFEQWHSDTMSYSLLLAIQLFLLAAMVIGAIRLPRLRAQPVLGKALLVLGCLYACVMLARLLAGVMQPTNVAWMNGWLDGVVPTAFHFVLAAYVLVSGHALCRASAPGATSVPDVSRVGQAIRYCAYPIIILVAYLIFFRLLETGSPLMFSAYLSVLIGATAILLHESLLPHREDWRPEREELINDGLFLVIVQVGLPALLKALALAGLVWLANENPMTASGFWPDSAPILVQVALMLVIAEFFRYWIHRGAHHYRALWRLHAVHHASDKLYTVNVGRFHPLDKALQFLGDSLPFLLLGISAEVFAAYFVFYAINGFYQHSNADVRLGWLNTIIAGPELHRWHHSASLKEAKSNFGNNLIVWDSIFGTRYLPVDKKLERIGIGNRAWPNGFLSQLVAPFSVPTESTPTVGSKERQGD